MLGNRPGGHAWSDDADRAAGKAVFGTVALGVSVLCFGLGLGAVGARRSATGLTTPRRLAVTAVVMVVAVAAIAGLVYWSGHRG